MKGERGFFVVVSVGYCFAQAFPFDALAPCYTRGSRLTVLPGEVPWVPAHPLC